VCHRLVGWPAGRTRMRPDGARLAAVNRPGIHGGSILCGEDGVHGGTEGVSG
jgi:hypothetical protein